jgi:hypothetical protein
MLRGTRIDGQQVDISSHFFNNIVSFSDDRVCEFLSKTVKRFNNSVESVREFLKEFKGCPLRPFFHNFEDCPLKACLLFLYNSGHAYFPKDLTHPMHSDVCPSMRPNLESASEMEEPVRKALEALQAYGDSFTAESFVTKRLLDFRQRVPLEGKLCACGCCGVRDQEQVLDRQNRNKMEFVTLTKEQLETLRMNFDDQRKFVLNTTYRRFRSHVQQGENCYNLHGHLVSTSDKGELQTYLCRECATALNKNEIPAVSIAAGECCTQHTTCHASILT